MTGYDLTQKINRFWRSTHSAIYPLLTELVDKEYVEFTSEIQCGKPDKKIYNLTPSGRIMLHDWFMTETSDSVTRDEMRLKLYCITCVDTDAAQNILDELELRYKNKIEKYTTNLENIRKNAKEKDSSIKSFGAYVLTQRGLNENILNLEWCLWVKRLYENKDSSFLDIDFISKIPDSL